MTTKIKEELKIAQVKLMDPRSAEGAEWEALVANNEQSGFMQSLYWAQFKQASEQTVFQLVVSNENKMIAGCLLYACPDPKRPSILLAPYGPVLPFGNDELASQCLRLIINEAEKIAANINAVSMRIEPRVPHPFPRILHEFARAPVNLVPATTMYLDLRQDLDTILQGMKPKCRYNTLLAERRGVTVREENGPEAANILYQLLDEASERDGFSLEHPSFFRILLDTLLPTGILRVFIAEHENDKLGALALITHGKKATYLYGGISNNKRHLMPGYALQWKAIRSAKELGCENYDFYGYDQFQSPSHSYARFSRFKQGFGGTPERFIGAQDYIFMDKLVDNVIGFFQDVSTNTPN